MISIITILIFFPDFEKMFKTVKANKQIISYQLDSLVLVASIQDSKSKQPCMPAVWLIYWQLYTLFWTREKQNWIYMIN